MSQTLSYISAASDGTVLGIDGSLILQGGPGSSWTSIASGFTGIGVAGDGTIWGIDASGIQQYSAGAWSTVPSTATATQIAVGGADHIWIVDKLGNVYQYEGASPGFVSKGTGIFSVSVSEDGTVWGLNGPGVPQQFNATAGTWSAPSPAPPEPAVSIGVGSAGWIWIAGKSGKVYQYDSGEKWQVVPSTPAVSVRSVACGDDVTVWGIDSSGNALSYDMDKAKWNSHGPAPSGALAQISVGDATTVWGVATGGKLYQIVPTGPVWNTVANNTILTSLAVAAADNVWGLDTNGNAYRNNGGLASWNPQPVTGGPFRTIAAGSDGTVWGILKAGGVVSFASGNWDIVPCSYMLTQLSVRDAKSVLAADGVGNAYAWSPAGWTVLKAVYDVLPSSVDIAADGTTLCVTTGGDVAFRVGDSWMPSFPSIKQVAAVSLGDIWAIGASGTAQQLVSSREQLGDGSIARRRLSPTAWDAESVFDEQMSTHLWIVNRATVLTGNEELKKLLKPFKSSKIRDVFHDNMCQGLYDADYVWPYNGPIYMGLPTWASHFYDPNTGLNWLGLGPLHLPYQHRTAVSECRKHFWKSLEAFTANDLAQAGYELGLSLHYMTDMTQPMHAANFTAISLKGPGYHVFFEKFVMAMQSAASAPASANSGIYSDDPGDYAAAAAWHSKSTYFHQVCSPNNLTLYRNLILPALWTALVPLVRPMLSDAIAYTAPFLDTWMRLSKHSVTHGCFVCAQTGFVIDASNSESRSPGNAAQTYWWNDTEPQIFLIRPVPNSTEGYCYIVAEVNSFVLDVQANSNQIVLNTQSGATTQMWKMIESHGTLQIQNFQSGLYLTAPQPQQPLVQMALTPGAAQQWILLPDSVSPLSLILADSVLVADASATPMMVYGPNNSPRQEFLWVPLGGGDNNGDEGYYMVLRNDDSGNVLTASTNGVGYALWNSQDAQKWQRVPTRSSASLEAIKNKGNGQYLYVASATSQTTIGFTPDLATASLWCCANTVSIRPTNVAAVAIDCSQPNVFTMNANNTLNQFFWWVPLGGHDAGYFMILNGGTGDVLTGQTDSVTHGGWTGADNQKWMRNYASLDSKDFNIQNKQTQLFMVANAVPNAISCSPSSVNATLWKSYKQVPIT